jgi:hypothetical protein
LFLLYFFNLFIAFTIKCSRYRNYIVCWYKCTGYWQG